MLAAPANIAPRLRYAEWLRARDNPRGDFIFVQCALDRLGRVGSSAECAALLKRESDLLRKHRRQSMWDGDLCGCDHVYGANNLHCLQSKMSQAGGYLEGFAHFVATAIMNPNNQRAASFVYYKEVLRPHWNPQVTGNARTLPPVKVKAGDPVAWQRQNCASGVQTNRSTEYDWMTFLWGIHQRETPGAIDYPTWVGIVKDGWCGGGQCTSSGTLTWGAVRANALSKFGSPFEPRMQRMDAAGFSSAVTEN